MEDAVRARSDPGLIRVATFRAPSERTGVTGALRALGDPRWGRCRWVGRRLLDDPAGMEVVVVSLWDDAAALAEGVRVGQMRMDAELRAALEDMATEHYVCRAYGAWHREERPLLIRLFRGDLIEGDPAAFDSRLAAAYVGVFEQNRRCASIAAGIDDAGHVILATLWTTWDAIVSATGGDLRQILPVRLPGFALAGSAVHYEVVTAEF